ncbi:hypothetical protein [Candidatus Alkanophaga liquidiphilum]
MLRPLSGVAEDEQAIGRERCFNAKTLDGIVIFEGGTLNAMTTLACGHDVRAGAEHV